MTEKQFVEIDDGLDFSIKHIESGETFYDCESVVEILNELAEENEQLKHFIQELTTKGTGKIHLANGNIYKVNAILTDFNR